MKHKWIILTAVLLLCLCAGAAAQVEINETNFPDGTFRAYVTRNFDSNGDKVLSDAEIALATSIDVSGMGIQSLQGIEYFAALELLYCGGNNLTSLDVSGCTALDSLQCSRNNLTSLDVSRCTALKWLDCIHNAYDIQVTSNGFFNLRMLPGNFVPSRAYNWTGGSVSVGA